jgi:hypothetical protein
MRNNQTWTSWFVCLIAIIALLTIGCGSDSSDSSTEQIELLGVQTAEEGTLEPIAGEDDLYTLTLTGVNPQVVVFSERPERLTEIVTMDESIEIFWSDSEPPNVALSGLVDGEDQILALELLSPSYDQEAATLTYTAKPLSELSSGLSHLDDDLVAEIPSAFTSVAIFIDSGSGCTPDSPIGSCADMG